MDFLTIDPARFRVSTLLKLDTEDLHELACKAVAVLTTYRLVIGRCLLAMHESKGYRRHGCSSAIHYACALLGMSAPSARECRRVAMALQELPELTLAAESGTVEWSKLREIVRRAVPTTELYWLQLAQKHSYREIEFLVSRTPYGSVPGEVDMEGDSYRTELRCSASPQLFALLDHARRVLSEQREEAMTTAQVLEAALATIMTHRPFGEACLEMARDATNKDLLAEKARLSPVVAEARELATEMGLLEAEHSEEFALELLQGSAISVDSGDSEERATEVLRSLSLEQREALQARGNPESSDRSARNIFGNFRSNTVDPTNLATSPQDSSNPGSANTHFHANLHDFGPRHNSFASDLHDLEPEVAALALGIPTTDGETAPPSKPSREENTPKPEEHGPPNHSWQNQRLRFNPFSRSATPAQRRELLRRDGWCCRTPGCPNKMWLHLHHQHQYSEGGHTTPDNLLCLCAGCHRNLHNGTLKITSTPNGELVYTNAQGTRLDRQADLHLAAWLDYYLGWSGKELDSHQARQWSGDWAVFAS